MYQYNGHTYGVEVDILANHVLSYIDTDYFHNATDLQKCDTDDILWMVDIAEDEPDFFKDNLRDTSFSIQRIIEDRGSIERVPVVDTMVDDDWQEILDGKIDETRYDDLYGKGIHYGLKKLVRDVVADKIKQKY